MLAISAIHTCTVIVTLQDTPADQRKYKMVVLGDVLTDLPEVSNFEEVGVLQLLPGNLLSLAAAIVCNMFLGHVG